MGGPLVSFGPVEGKWRRGSAFWEEGTTARGRRLPTGIEAIDSCGGGGLLCGGISEIVGEGPSSGGQLILCSLLQSLRRRGGYAALVDASDSFDPQSAGEELLENLLWVRCRSVREAFQAVDILARDKNFAIVAFDLRWGKWRELRRIALTTWYRLQRVTEQSEVPLVVFSAEPVAASAQLRLRVSGAFGIDSCEAERAALSYGLQVEALRRRGRVAMGGSVTGG